MAFVVLAAVLAAYANSLRVPFVYDDIPSIPENATLRSLSALSTVLQPPVQGGITVGGRPVLNLSFALNYAISGTNPWSYHLANALVHAASALLLLGLARRALANTFAGEIRMPKTACVIALLWALHPLQTQAITYTVQRAESLMGFFYLATLYAFARSLEGGTARWRGVSVAVCALGMATKEVMVTAPLLVLLYDRTFVGGSFAAVWRRRRGYYVALGLTWGVLLALVAGSGGNRGGTVGLGVGVPLWAYPLTQFEALARYLALSVWPAPLIFEYGTFWVQRAGEIVPYAIVVLPLLGATMVALRRWPRAGFLGTWFFLILAPSSLAPGTIQMIVEHRMYLPLAAVVAGGVVGLRVLLGPRGLWLAGATALPLLALTLERNTDYRSRLTLWSDTVAQRPLNPRAREPLAEAYEELQEFEAAVQQRRESVRLAPDDWKYLHNLARALAATDRLPEAIHYYESALRLAPGEPRVHHNLAIALLRSRRLPEALAHHAAALRRAPDEPQYHFNYAVALLQAERTREAAEHFAAALRLQAEDAPARFDRVAARFGLASALAAERRFDEAIAHYEAVLQAAPQHADAHYKLANAFFALDRLAEAERHYRAALQMKPDDAEAHQNLGVTYARQERWADAQREFETALRLQPDYVDARRNLERVRALRGR